MPMTIRVQYPDSLIGKGSVEKIDKMKPSILLEVGKSLQELLAEWMRQLNSTRGKHPSEHFSPTGIHEPVVQDSNVSVPIYIPGITRALHDITIRPVEAKALAIPVDVSAYGISPREYNNVHPKGTKDALFIPSGKDYLARKDANNVGKLILMYLFKDEVFQAQDRTLLPPDDEMNKTIMDAVHNSVQAILQM